MQPRRTVTPITAPAIEPVTVAEVKLLARIDDDSGDDALITDFIVAARTTAEQYTRRSFITQTHKLTLDLQCDDLYNSLPEGTYDLPATLLYGELPRAIRLPKPPLISVTSVATTDISDVTTTFASSNYLVDTVNNRIVLNQSILWPSNLRPAAAAAITYTAGYGLTADTVPSPIRMAIRIHAADLYQSRGLCGCDTPPEQGQALLRQYRDMEGM